MIQWVQDEAGKLHPFLEEYIKAVFSTTVSNAVVEAYFSEYGYVKNAQRASTDDKTVCGILHSRLLEDEAVDAALPVTAGWTLKPDAYIGDQLHCDFCGRGCEKCRY